MNILFIGNSYTYVNDMPKLFETIAKDNRKDVNVFSVTKGGHKLHLYARENDEYTQKIDSLISENLFDICFFQEQSCLPVTDYELFAQGVTELAKRVKKSVKSFILYATWGRKEESEMLSELGISSSEMTDKLSIAYKEAAKLINAAVSPVGENFKKVYPECKDIELYDKDCSHPSYKGSCLAALTHYYTVFREFPENTSSLSLTDKEIDVFKKAVVYM